MRRPVDHVPVHVDLRGLERLLAEIRDLSTKPEQKRRLVHALRNLAHVASLLADVLRSEDRDPTPNERGRSTAGT